MRSDPEAPAIAVVIPVLDEALTLPAVLAAIPPSTGTRIVVVDNGSTDGTADLARKAGALVVDEPRRGYGAACLAGLAALRGSPPRVVAFLDGDGSDDPSELPRVVAPILEGRCDLVVVADIAGKDHGARERRGKFPDVLLESLALKSEGESCPLACRGQGDGPRDAAFVGYPQNQTLAIFQEHQRVFLCSATGVGGPAQGASAASGRKNSFSVIPS